jgi:N-acetylmuramoyl-L-alanine amidase
MKVIQNLVSSSKYNTKCPYSMNAEFIVVHNTANDASARNEISYMIRNNNEVSFHYAIDDKEIVQGIPENRNAWHAGDGENGKGNRKGLSVEICYSKSGGQKFIEAEKLAAKFIAFKLNEKGWNIDKVKKHQDFSGKYCPHRTLDMGWQRFLNMIKAELNSLNKPKGGNNMANNNTPSTWAKEAWDWAKKEGIMDGNRPKDNMTREEFATVIHRLYKSGKLR